MQRLHPNALWLFWFRSLLGIFPGAGGRRTARFITSIMVIILYVVVISYGVSSISHLISTSLGQGDIEGEMSFSGWRQETTSKFNIPKVTGIAVVILLAFLGFTFLKAYLYYNYYRYQIGENSIRVKKGVFSLHEAEVPYDRIQNIDIFRGILHRILGLSSIYIQTAGYSETTESTLERHPGFVSEASIDGITKQEAERIRQELLNKKSKQGI